MVSSDSTVTANPFGATLPWQSLTLEQSSLGTLEPFDRGGEGELYEVHASGSPGLPLLFKRYHPNRREVLQAAHLHKLVAVSRALQPRTLDWLYQRAAWPSWVVEDFASPVGILIPMAPAPFMTEVRRSSGGRRRIPAKMELLLNGDEFLQNVGLSISPRQRMELLVSVAETMAFFHSQRMFVGDFSCKNLLYALEPSPAAYFIDCDSMSWQGLSVLPLGETPEWELPSGQALGSAAADVYKFGLLALRLHTGAQHHRSLSRLPEAVPGTVRELLEHSLSPVPTERPLITEWLAPLQAAVSVADASPCNASRVPVRSVARVERTWMLDPPATRAVPHATRGKREPQTLLPPGRINDALMAAARRLLVRRQISPSIARLAVALVGLWVGFAVVLGCAMGAGVDPRHLSRGSEFGLSAFFIALAGLAFFLATSEPA